MMTIPIAILAVLLPLNLMASDAAKNAKLPDTIFLNGDIYTQATPARAQAMAVRDGRIVAVGSNDDIRKLKGSHTQVVDLGGHFVMPGFNDAHCICIGRLRADERRSGRRRSRWPRCSSASPTMRRLRPRATGSSAAAGTTRCGRGRSCRRARTSTRVTAWTSGVSSCASTGISPSRTQRR